MTSIFDPAPEPKSELGRYRILSNLAGAKVSPLCLGAMSIGQAWEKWMGVMNKEDSYKLMDRFYELGGNFIDTANNYQDEESERWIGDWMHERKIRDHIFLATKYTTDYRSWDIGKGRAPNFCGNNKKSLHLSVQHSLKKLKTYYIDLLYLHWWDWTTGIEEVMNSLHILVEQGKVLYLGISDTPAWIVSAANTYAIRTGKTPFSVYQGKWNVGTRDFERDIIPMARHFGMALCPWDVIGGGRWKTPEQQKEREGEGSASTRAGTQSDADAHISKVLAKVGKEVSASPSAVAIAYVMQKTTHVFPIIGGRKTAHLEDNIKALEIHLSDKQIEELESVKEFDIGFPMTFVSEDPHVTGESARLVKASAPVAYVRRGKPIGHE